MSALPRPRNPITIGPVSRKNMLSDPRYALASQLMNKDVEVTDWASGLNKALSQALGAKQLKDLNQEYQGRDERYNQDIARALQTMSGSAEQNFDPNKFGPYQKEQVNYGATTPDPALAQQLLLQNPDTQELGLQFALEDMKSTREERSAEKKYSRERADKLEDFEKEAELKKELASLKSGGTFVTDPDTGEITYEEGPRKLSSTEQKEFYEAKDLTDSISNALGTLDQVQKIAGEDMFTGMGSTAAAFANRIPLVGRAIDDDKAANTTTYNNLLKELAYSRLKATFPGAISNSEREALERLQALSSYSKPEQEKIISEAKKVLQRQQNIAKQKQDGIVTGNVYNSQDQSPVEEPTQQETPRQKLERLRALKAKRP